MRNTAPPPGKIFLNRLYHVPSPIAQARALVDNPHTPPYNPNHGSPSSPFSLVPTVTTIRQLFEIQELDLAVSQRRERIAMIDNQLGNRSELDAVAAEVDASKDNVDRLRTQQRAQERDAESMRQKLGDVDSKLYGGTIQNLRELEGFQKESGILRVRLKDQDDRVLEAMMALEEAQGALRSLEDAFRQANEGWHVSQAELGEERKGLEQQMTSLEAGREALVARVGHQEMKLYEDLRLSKGGVAIAKVERGLCRGCRLALPTHQLQRAKAGREPALCNSCGRILYVS